MNRVVDVEINKVNALITLGSMYRNGAEAVKEYVSNALDEWTLAQREGKANGPCDVVFILARNAITIDYNAPGMDEKGFEEALKHVVDSAKRRSRVPLIGQLGIGLWAFNQVGEKATFLSKRDLQAPTIKVTLRRDSASAEFSTPRPSEERKDPGMTILITGLFQDPTRRYGPLSSARLKHVLADRFDAYLRSGHLRITIESGKEETPVEPIDLDLPQIGSRFAEMSLPQDPDKAFNTMFWFDPSGNGRVSIRHRGVVIIDDLNLVPEYGLQDGIYTSGMIKGFVDADFLRPLPARAQFVEDEDLAALFGLLREIGPQLAGEIDVFQQDAEKERRLSLMRRATRIAREVLSQEEFMDLELIQGFSRIQPRSAKNANGVDKKRSHMKSSNGSNGGHSARSYRSFVRPTVFDDDVRRRSRVVDGAIEINVNSPDFLALVDVPKSHQVAYIAMLLGKEMIAYNDSSGVSDDALERLVSYGSKVLTRVWR